MKPAVLKISLVLLFFCMLLRPETVFLGARSGLLLWFETVLPTLLPFILISNLLIHTNAFSYLTRLFGPIIRQLFGTSEEGSFAVLTGFLCGYPMGAKTTADLIRSGHITQAEGTYLLSFCNNTSIGFIMNYIFFNILQRKDLAVPGLFILLLSPVLASIFFRIFYYHKYHLRTFQSPKSQAGASHSCSIKFDLLDTCIMDSFETITNIGGYIIFFSILLALLQESSILPPCAKLFLPALEMTNGILLLTKMFPSSDFLFPAVCALTSFGGICAAAQTNCMIRGSGLRIVPYLIEKLITALVTSLLCLLYLHHIL